VKIHLIVNPKASRYRPERALMVERALRDGNELTLSETLYRGHAIDLAREAAHGGAEVVAVLGGDGTLNEAANGLVGTETAMACLPAGSTNVFARTIGFKAKLTPALEQLTAALGRPPRRVGLGLVNGRYFLFHVGMGFDAAVVAEVEKKPHLKATIGQGVFVYAAFATWLRTFDRTRPHLTVREGDRILVNDGYFAVCLNTNPYTYFGVRPLNLAPGAGLDTALSLVTLRTLELGTTLALVGSSLVNGKKLRSHPMVDYREELSAVTVSGLPGEDGSQGSFPYQADGDYLGEAQQLTFSHEPDRLLLVMP
jgi:diacylglycerol kinase family enzyme